mmetsp:Transcript_40974/g.97350  ORF Transcript_40974/g.97350 Transcript_40974/m.97350 type:complete len:105 (-) Transcript_40974:411-725(-)
MRWRASQGSVSGPQTPPTQASPSAKPAADRPRGAPLRQVVADGVQRWFQETFREAHRGDVKQQALLAEMLLEGYGCAPDPEAAREWAEKARRRGYRMRGVYCEL